MKPKTSGAQAPGATFRRVGSQQAALPHLERASARPGYRVYQGQNGFQAAIAEHVVERLARWCQKEAPLEAYGLLVGRAFKDPQGHHVVVLGVVPDPEAKAQCFFVETTPLSEIRTRLTATLLYPDCVILGWVHTHPKIGAQYSGVDRDNQATWTAPYSLGIVVDPWDPALLSVYRGPESELLGPVAMEQVPARTASETTAPTAPTPTGPVPSTSASRATAPIPAARAATSRPSGCTHALSVLVHVALVLGALLASAGLWRTHVLEERVARLEEAVRSERPEPVFPTEAPVSSFVASEKPAVCEAPVDSRAP